ncbi:glycosyltransferase family 4 protein [Paenibacillus sp. NPDC058177]|uniref:glycosyltransferase family 4 protein n=1 Tax=Paenibacillus sp. NPDC058177 TaxID=3346369 RepID=UPI0036DAF4B5
MHICIIAPEQFPVPGDSSVEICIWAIAERLAEKHKVTIVSRSMPNLPDTEKLARVEIVRLPAGSPARYRSSVLKYIEGKDFDIFQVDNRPYLLAAVKQKQPLTPAVLFLHSLTFVPASDKTAARLARADLIVANSASLQQRLARRFPRIKRSIDVVPLGADLSRFAPVSQPERLRLRGLHRFPPAFTVLFVGRIIPRKGVPVLIRAVALLNRLTRAHLVVTGRGKPAYIRRLRQLARRLGVPVTFPGSVPHEDIHSLYQAADVFVCPSQRHESFGLVNVEAMASGLPVVASSNGGIREIIVPGHNGYLVKRYTQALPFARYLLRLARDPVLAARIGAQGRSDALQTFEWQHTADRLEVLYHGFCSEDKQHIE